MIQLNQIYKCSVCGNVVEVVGKGGGTMVCCDKPMELMVEKTNDIGQEKHVPVVEKTDTGIKVKIGSVPHPMEESHYIQWIEVIIDGKSSRVNLSPGMKPEAEFCTTTEIITVREFCNIHLLWKTP